MAVIFRVIQKHTLRDIFCRMRMSMQLTAVFKAVQNVPMTLVSKLHTRTVSKNTIGQWFASLEKHAKIPSRTEPAGRMAQTL